MQEGSFCTFMWINKDVARVFLSTYSVQPILSMETCRNHLLFVFFSLACKDINVCNFYMLIIHLLRGELLQVH